jgi:Sigma-70, region 4
VAGYVARRLRKELHRSEPLAFDPPARLPPEGDDRADILTEEVDRLPQKYRVPVLMHYSAGLSTADIAERLGCPKGTVLTRLDRGRKLLERRLAARGWTAGALMVGAVARPLSAAWILATARGAVLLRDGQSPLPAGVSTRSVSLIEGVIRAMTSTKLRYVVLAIMLATGLGGFALGQFGLKPAAEKKPPAAADKPQQPSPLPPPVEELKPAKVDDAKPGTGRRREAVIKIPVGTFVKDVDAGEYGSGRLTWTFEDDKVFGTIEANVMGVEFELKTEAEFSLSGNGTIYGIVTSAEVTHLKVGGALLGEGVGEYAKFVKLAEPLLNEMLTDLPFSYQFRLSGDKLTILNYRALLAGPNPLGKLGGLVGGGDNGLGALTYFQSLGLAVEGTYTAGDAEPQERLKAKPILRKPTGKKTGLLTPGQYKSDPSIKRVDALLHQADELKQVNEQRQRFWLNDQPSHLTPERIHGGIGP